MADAPRDENFVPAALFEIDGSPGEVMPGQIDEATGRILVDSASGTGTVTSVSVVSANGFAGSVANPTTTPAITLSTTITGVLKGNGTAISAADSSTDYAAVAFKTISVSGQSDVVADTPVDTLTLVAGTNVTITTNATTDTITINGPVTTGFANTALSNLASVAVNTALLPGADNSIALGDATHNWSDLFLGSGALINFANGDVTITHSSALLTFSDPITVTGVVTGEGFAPTATTATGNRMYLPAANTLGFAINGTGELQLTSTALSPISDDGLALGTTALGWQSLFGDTGFVINIENGNWVATHTSAVLTVGTGDLRVTTAGSDTASVVTVGGTQTLTSKTLTSPAVNTATIGGITTMAEGASFSLDAVLSADGAYTGTTIAGTAGAILAFGDCVYLAAADSKWELADADSVTTSGPVLLGICVLAAAEDAATRILLHGTVRADTAFPALTVSAPAYVGNTAGDIQVAAPNGDNDVVRIVGQAIDANSLFVNPSPDWVVLVV